jgi:hypothetical protein
MVLVERAGLSRRRHWLRHLSAACVAMDIQPIRAESDDKGALRQI